MVLTSLAMLSSAPHKEVRFIMAPFCLSSTIIGNALCDLRSKIGSAPLMIIVVSASLYEVGQYYME